MAHVQPPNSIDISNEDYSIQILCLQCSNFLKDKSTPYKTRFPDQVNLRFRFDTDLFSSSDPDDQVTYHHSPWKEVSVPSTELVSGRCADAVKRSLDMVHIPFSLSDKKLEWVAAYLNWHCRCGIDLQVINRKTLESTQELVSEIARNIRNSSDIHCGSLETITVELCIKKVVAQPQSVIESWKIWDHHMKVAKLLKKRRLREGEGEFDPEEICSICLERLPEDQSPNHRGGDHVVRLDCSHVFHESCIWRWFHVKISCPYCRALIKIPHRGFVI